MDPDPVATPKCATVPLPQSTPVKIGTSTTCPFTTNQKFRIPSCTAMAEEIAKFIVGPMPAQEFLDDFFPTKKLRGLSQVPLFMPGCYDDTLRAKYEVDAYEPFVSASKKPSFTYFNAIPIVFKIAATAQFLPDLRLVDTSSNPDGNPRSSLPFKIKPDVTIYPGGTNEEKTDSSISEIFTEFKWNIQDDPFCDVHNVGSSESDSRQSFLHDTQAGKDTLGQITSYAAAQLGAQFRTHAYSVFILRDTARILQWDRSGTIVTEAIKYNEDCFLAEFFRRYSKASPAMRGKDMSASLPTALQAQSARKALELDPSIPLVKLSIPSGAGNTLHYFVVPAPSATLYTPPGRATRGFKAYDISHRNVVFLKDSWRIDLPDIHKEGSVYKILNEAEVANVPQCIVSGDILIDDYHATKTNFYTEKPWACRSGAQFIPHQHCRLVLDVLGRVLHEYSSSYEMVSAVRNALIGEWYNSARSR